MKITPDIWPWLNLLILALLAYLLYRGWKRGFLLTLLDLLTVFAAIGIGWIGAQCINALVPAYQNYVAAGTLDVWQASALGQLLWFSVCALFLFGLLSFWKQRIRHLDKLRFEARADRIGGLLVSIAFAFVFLMLIALLLSTPAIEGGAEYVRSGVLNDVQKAGMAWWQKGLGGTMDLPAVSSQLFSPQGG